jgi:hypothetical protein
MVPWLQSYSSYLVAINSKKYCGSFMSRPISLGGSLVRAGAGEGYDGVPRMYSCHLYTTPLRSDRYP